MVMDRARLVASLPNGPQHPRAGTPPRRPGSVRRTTAIEQRWDDFGQPQDVVASGRDLRTALDGTATVVDRARVDLWVAGDGTVASVEVDPAHPALDGLVGSPTRSGFRAAAAALVPEHRDEATVLHQLLDDVPLAALIASYGLTREHPEWNIPLETAQRLTDLCSGWAAGATMLDALETTGIFPIPVGPIAPPLTDADDPLAWHELEVMTPRTVRRVRRLDLATDPAGGPLALEVYFRDSHLGLDGVEDVLHEYTVDATVDPASLVVLSSTAVAHTLPWPECPGALTSAGRIVGHPVADLPALVGDTFTGTSTCSHLNDLLRSIAGVASMAAALR